MPADLERVAIIAEGLGEQGRVADEALLFKAIAEIKRLRAANVGADVRAGADLPAPAA